MAFTLDRFLKDSKGHGLRIYFSLKPNLQVLLERNQRVGLYIFRKLI